MTLIPLREEVNINAKIFKGRRPTVFHVTHHKAGSQWVAEVLKHAAGSRFVKPQLNVGHVCDQPIRLGRIYPTVYLPRERLDQYLKPMQTGRDSSPPSLKTYHRLLRTMLSFQTMRSPVIRFVVIRDLRDTLISLYYSSRYSHPLLKERVAKRRELLKGLEKEDALIYLIQGALKRQAHLQMSWIESTRDFLLVRYEDLLANEFDMFRKIIDYCEMPVSSERLYEIVNGNSFENFTGRKRGDEDVYSHQRKGIAGDWRNHFTDRIKKIFKQKWGEVLIKTGYEQDLNW